MGDAANPRVAAILNRHNDQLDEEIRDYICVVLDDEDLVREALSTMGGDGSGGEPCELEEALEPLLLDSEVASDEAEVRAICLELAKAVVADDAGGAGGGGAVQGEAAVARKPLVIAEQVEAAGNEAAAMLSADKLRAQYKVPTLPQVSDREKQKLERRRQRQEEAAERELQHHRDLAMQMHSRASDGASEPVIMRNQGGPPIRDLHLENIEVVVGGKELVKDCALTLTRGSRYGLVGRNGTGKTSLLRVLSSREDFKGLPDHCQVLHVEQEISGGDATVLQCVLDCDVERKQLLEREAELLKVSGGDAGGAGGGGGGGGGGKPAKASGKDDAPEQAELMRIYQRLEEIDASSAEAKASKILHGLSFDEAMQNRPTKTFSGGWRMRVALARALFVQPDLLMLDEPTNHLDLHAVLWLEDYLLKWPTILVLVSHSRGFLNNVCTDIVHLHSDSLTHYSGTYDNFQKARAERLRNQRKAAESQEAKRKHMEDFITKFRANAKRASMVQSRIKALNRMEEISVVAEDPDYHFQFPDPGDMGTGSLIGFDNVAFGYKPEAMLFSDLNFGIDSESRIALVGANGAGKTTLLKLMTGALQPTAGTVTRSTKAKIATFSQHHVDSLDLALCPLEYLRKEFPETSEPTLRGHLSSFGVPADLQMRNMYKMSGGQKSRVAFAKITFMKPHILLLDEPSNHLDMDAVDALIHGLNSFNGCVLLVSHDEHLIGMTASELWVCEDKQCKAYKGSFEDYKKSLRK